MLHRFGTSLTVAVLPLTLGLSGAFLVLMAGLISLALSRRHPLTTKENYGNWLETYGNWLQCVMTVSAVFVIGIAFYSLPSFPIALLLLSPLFGTVAFAIDTLLFVS